MRLRIDLFCLGEHLSVLLDQGVTGTGDVKSGGHSGTRSCAHTLSLRFVGEQALNLVS